MGSARVLVLALCAAVLVAGAPVATSTAAPVASVSAGTGSEGTAITRKLSRLTRQLDVGRERSKGYQREKFRHWVDADSDGCDTRDEVLLKEAVEDPGVAEDCDLTGGEWFSYYDGETVEDSSDLDIDHLVALAEAWASGARGWTRGTRERFANDLRDRRSLVAVTASSNRSKSDRDPAEWLPRPRAHCRYVREWVAVKTRWRLRVDRTEKRTLNRLVGECTDVEVKVRLARVVRR